MSLENPAGERVVITTVRGPSSYQPGGFNATLRGVNQVARELSGEYKIAILNSYPSMSGSVTQSGFVPPYVPTLVSGAPVISGNVVNLQVLTTISGYTAGSGFGYAEVASGVSLSNLIVSVIAQCW